METFRSFKGDVLLWKLGDTECFKQRGRVIRFELGKDGFKTEGA